VLLDALDALGDQRDAVVLVGAQAIYLHTGAAELAVAEFTTDSDLGIDPSALEQAISYLRELFSLPDAPGSTMAARAASPLEPEDEIRASCAVLSQDLLRTLE
jgi:hypothetical protein